MEEEEEVFIPEDEVKNEETIHEEFMIEDEEMDDDEYFTDRESPVDQVIRYKKTFCKFCHSPVVSKNFTRHLQRHHSYEKRVIEIFSLKKNTKERSNLIALLRNEGNLERSFNGKIIPRKIMPRMTGESCFRNVENYALCFYCKAYYQRLYLRRHMKTCFMRKGDKVKRPLSESLIFTARQKKYGHLLETTAIKKLFSRMRPDKITCAAMEDPLIILYGKDLVQKNGNKKNVYLLTKKIRECARFLLHIRKINVYADMLSTLKPECFNDAKKALKIMTKSTAKNKVPAASSIMNFGSTIRQLINVAFLLISKEDPTIVVENVEKTLNDLEKFKIIVENEWIMCKSKPESTSNSMKRKIAKPKLLPLTEDIIKLKTFVDLKAQHSYETLTMFPTMEDFKILVDTTFISLSMHNRRRTNVIQYLELNSYDQQPDDPVEIDNIMLSISESEKMLTSNYKTMITFSADCDHTITFVPKKVQKYLTMIRFLRDTVDWFPNDNRYFFTYPNSTSHIDGKETIRKYGGLCGIQYPHILASSQLRYYLATVCQIVNLGRKEISRISKNVKIFNDIKKPLEDVHQIAKISKILQLAEREDKSDFKDKSLEEFDVDLENTDEIMEDDTENTDESAFVDVSCIIKVENHSNMIKPVEFIPENLFESSLNETSDNEIPIYRKEKNSKRHRWNDEQKQIVRHFFANHISTSTAPKKSECNQLRDMYPATFQDVDWVKIKTFVFNEYVAKKDEYYRHCASLLTGSNPFYL